MFAVSFSLPLDRQRAHTCSTRDFDTLPIQRTTPARHCRARNPEAKEGTGGGGVLKACGGIRTSVSRPRVQPSAVYISSLGVVCVRTIHVDGQRRHNVAVHSCLCRTCFNRTSISTIRTKTNTIDFFFYGRIVVHMRPIQMYSFVLLQLLDL